MQTIRLRAYTDALSSNLQSLYFFLFASLISLHSAHLKHIFIHKNSLIFYRASVEYMALDPRYLLAIAVCAFVPLVINSRVVVFEPPRRYPGDHAPYSSHNVWVTVLMKSLERRACITSINCLPSLFTPFWSLTSSRCSLILRFNFCSPVPSIRKIFTEIDIGLDLYHRYVTRV